MKLIILFIFLSLALTVYSILTQPSIVLVILLVNLLTLLILHINMNKREDVLKKIEKKIESIDFDKIVKKIDSLRDEQTNYMLKGFEVEMELAKYKEEQEEKYREVVKKILELDNKFTEKYELLGKTVIKLSKDGKKP
ncbi:MAG: hypothetical protein N3E38_01695 [Candidatus Aenigmarchaeota archaeon]|nr:hypothetical protein [Candidatus Aenigmarchaeota archaeon]MCX8179433.1 hypothetical protein [Candidatus Aenigmarchaeota archaeon]